MKRPILKSEKSERLLGILLELPFDRERVERELKNGAYSPDEVTRAGYDFSGYCMFEDNDEAIVKLENGGLASKPLFRPRDKIKAASLRSTNITDILRLLLEYGLDPNAVFNESADDILLACLIHIKNEYVAADAVKLLIENGADVALEYNDVKFIDDLLFKAAFDSIEMRNRDCFDSLVHVFMVVIAALDNEWDGKPIVDVYPRRGCETDSDVFKVSDLFEHRNFYFALTYTPRRGENYSLHIIDRRTGWEVARY